MLTMTLLAALSLPTPDSLGKIAIFLAMLSAIVVIHEGGHFLLARLNGVRVNDFAVGFGPTLLKWTSPHSGTNYRLNLLPIGGYCAMQGEDGVTSEAEQQRNFRAEHAPAPGSAYARSGVAVLERPATEGALAVDRASLAPSTSDNFQSKSTWQRLSIVVAGPVANFLLALAIMYVAAITVGVPNDKISPEIGPIMAGTPAQKAGLQIGDRITAIDHRAYTSGDAIVEKIHASAGVPLVLTIGRGSQTLDVPVTPMLAKDTNGQLLKDGKTHKTYGQVGFQIIPDYERVGPLEAVPLAFTACWLTITRYITSLAAIPSHLGSVHGVIGMGQAASQVQDLGWAQYIGFAAILSIGLGVLNLLPFPALDGGRGIFILAEMLRGRPIDAEKEALVHVAGFAVIMVLMVALAFHDILNIINGKSVFD